MRRQPHTRARTAAAPAAPRRIELRDDPLPRWVEQAARRARELARWQLRIELAIVTAAAALVVIPAIATALGSWWRS